MENLNKEVKNETTTEGNFHIKAIMEDLRHITIIGKPRQYVHGDNFYQFTVQELKEGEEVYLLDSCGKKQFKAKYHPTDKESRIVHCRHLKDDEERFLITCVYKANITNCDEDFHVEDTYLEHSLYKPRVSGGV